MSCVIVGVILFLFLMWCIGKNKRRKANSARDPAALERWQKSETRDVKRSRNPRVTFCLANIGRPVTIIYHETRRTVTPVRVFRKPQYWKTYVLAIENGEEKHFDIGAITFVADTRAARARPGCASKALTSLLLGGAVVWGIYTFGPHDEQPKRQPTAIHPEEGTASQQPTPATSARGKDTSKPAPEATANAPSDKPPKKQSYPDSAYRKWTDSTGTYHVEAAFAGQHGPTITLEKRDGKQINLSLYKLSEADRAWLQEHRERAAHQ